VLPQKHTATITSVPAETGLAGSPWFSSSYRIFEDKWNGMAQVLACQMHFLLPNKDIEGTFLSLKIPSWNRRRTVRINGGE